MTIGKGWLFIIALIIALGVLAPDSKVGGEIRDLFSQLRNSSGTFLDQIGEGSRDTGNFVAE